MNFKLSVFLLTDSSDVKAFLFHCYKFTFLKSVNLLILLFWEFIIIIIDIIFDQLAGAVEYTDSISSEG